MFNKYTIQIYNNQWLNILKICKYTEKNKSGQNMIINKGSFIRRQYVIPIGSRIIKSLIGRFLGGFSDCREQFYLLKNRNNEFYRLRRSFGIEKTQIMPIREQIL